VQKFGRLTLLLIGGLSIFGAVVFLALNLYVQSQGIQARIQQELRQRFGATLKIGRISVTPWSGLKLSGITIAQGTIGANGNFLEAKNFGLRIAFFSLFSRRLVIKEVSLVSPKVVWPQNAEGKWRLPDLRPERSQSTPNIAAEAESSSPAESENSETPGQSAATATAGKQPKRHLEQKTNACLRFTRSV